MKTIRRCNPSPPQPSPPQPPPQPPAAPPYEPDPVPAALSDPFVAPCDIPITGVVNPVQFPTSYSQYVSIAGKDAGARDAREVWDLRSGQRFGGASGAAELNNAAVSPDGAYLAARNPTALKTTVDVWRTGDPRTYKVVMDEKPIFPEIDFAGPDQLLTAKPDGAGQTYQIWDIEKGTELRRFTAPAASTRQQRAFSGGRRYMAVCGPFNGGVLVFDLTTGKQAVQLPTVQNAVVRGLAFSPDGKMLAGLIGTGFTVRLQTWDLTTAQPAFGRDFDKHPQTTVQNGFGYQGAPLEWLPDGGGWLLYGQLLVDAKTGVVFWRVPNDGNDPNPRRIFPGGALASVKSDGRHKSLVVETLPADRIAAAQKAVRGGQDPAAATLPPAKPADWSAVRELPAPAGAVDWKAAADPAGAPPAALGAKPAPLGGKAGDIVRILFSAPVAAKAVVLTAAGADALGAGKQVHAARYDLLGGQLLNESDLFTAEFPRDRLATLDADLSPDGSLLAVREPRNGKRIDIYSMTDGKHVVGWLPYEKEGDGAVQWFAFLDGERLLTLGAGKLTLWNVPECRAVYSAGFVRGAPALSPGRKYLAAFTGSGFEVLEAATGERVGQILRPNAVAVQAAAFRPDGRELAAVLATTDGTRLARWDATTGAAKDEFAVPPGMGALEWCGPNDVLFDQTLIDLELKQPIALYNLPGFGRHAPNGPDGRHWFACATGKDDAPLLTAEALPDDAVRQLKKQIAAGQVQLLLAPGMSVTVRVDGAGPDANADAYRNNLAASLTQRLQQEGYKPGPGGTLTLAVQIQPARDTGRTAKYDALSGGGRQVVDVHVQQVAVQATLTDGRGGVIWKQETTVQTPLPQTAFDVKDLQTALNKGMWDGVAGWVGTAGAPPTGLIRTAAGVEPLPRPVILK